MLVGVIVTVKSSIIKRLFPIINPHPIIDKYSIDAFSTKTALEIRLFV